MISYGRSALKSFASFCVVASLIGGECGTSVHALEDPLGETVRAVTQQVDASVVRLRPIGGTFSADSGLPGAAPTTGLVISENGEILTSAFALQGNPQTVLVERIDGKRFPAEIVATDYLRRLVLLRTNANDIEWKSPGVTPRDAVRIGQWLVAVGRFYSSESSNIAVGIASARNRIHGLALQTDARISPMNYGGPLVDLNGNVHGILVPLSPSAGDNANAGVEWYDSGIGFAIPLQDALESAQKLRTGKDLHPGKLGVSLKSSGRFSAIVQVARTHRGGPCDLAGIRSGDRIMAVNGISVERPAILESAVARTYAGEVLKIDIQRGEERLSFDVELSEKLPALEMAWLGVLPVPVIRRPAAGELPPAGAEQILQPPQSPASPEQNDKDEAGKEPGVEESPDKPPGLEVVVLEKGSVRAAVPESVIRLLSVDSVRTDSVGDLFAAMSRLSPLQTVPVTYLLPGNSEEKTVSITTAKVPLAPDTITSSDLQAGKNPEETGPPGTDTSPARQEIDMGDAGKCIVFSPPSQADRQSGLVILLSADIRSEEAVLRRWKDVIQSHELTVMIPVNPEQTALTDEDIPMIGQAMGRVITQLRIDRTRLVVVADSAQAATAKSLLLSERSPVRGVAMESGWFLPEKGFSIKGTAARWALLLEPGRDRQTQLLAIQAAAALTDAGLNVIQVSPTDDAAEPRLETTKKIGDWTLLIKSL